MARFTELEPDGNYDIVSGTSGHYVTQGIQGADALMEDWPDGAEAWPAGEETFNGSADEIAE